MSEGEQMSTVPGVHWFSLIYPVDVVFDFLHPSLPPTATNANLQERDTVGPFHKHKKHWNAFLCLFTRSFYPFSKPLLPALDLSFYYSNLYHHKIPLSKASAIFCFIQTYATMIDKEKPLE